MVDNLATCVCDEGYTGSKCVDFIDACISSPCKNGSTCNLFSAGIFTCICQDGTDGELCQNIRDLCIKCDRLGTKYCDSATGSYKCTCNEGFEGRNCDMQIDYCEDVFCRRRAECESIPPNTYQNQPGTYICHCLPGWDGQHCQIRVDSCHLIDCNSGTCSMNGNYPMCTCPDGFRGGRCEINLNECESNPCPTTRCIDRDNAYECACEKGYTGVGCDVEINECESNPCHAESTCIEMRGNEFGEFRCDCPFYLEDRLCNSYVGDCHEVACVNGGTCLDDENKSPFRRVCLCPVPFTGENCEIKHDLPCESNPCQNGRCNDNLVVNFVEQMTYECECIEGWTGVDCERSIQPCASDPCQNGATCTEVQSENRSLGTPRMSLTFRCTCVAGFTGDNCEIKPPSNALLYLSAVVGSVVVGFGALQGIRQMRTNLDNAAHEKGYRKHRVKELGKEAGRKAHNRSKKASTSRAKSGDRKSPSRKRKRK